MHDYRKIQGQRQREDRSHSPPGIEGLVHTNHLHLGPALPPTYQSRSRRTARRSRASEAAWMRTIVISGRLAIRVWATRSFVVRPAARSVGASPAAPLGGIRQHEQVQTGEQERGEREQRQETHPDGILLLCHGDDVDDDAHRKGNGQPAVGLPNPFVPVQGDLLTTLDPPEAASWAFQYRTALRTRR